MTANLTVDGDTFIVSTEFFDNQRAKDIPDRNWWPVHNCWVAPVNKTNAIYIENTFKATEIDSDAIEAIRAIKEFTPVTEPFPGMTYKTEPMAHQLEALQRAWSPSEFAFFMDMGTGKTWTAINLAGARFLEGQINALAVVCPTSVKPVWPDELEHHCSVPYYAHVHEAGGNAGTQAFTVIKEPDKLKVLIVGVESLSQGKAWTLLNEFCEAHSTMIVVDESSTIKTPPKSKGGKIVPSRTSRCWDAAELCAYRYIMSGTPITQGIQDLFAQFRFLNWEILGNKNYYSFKARYTVSGGFQNKKIIGYKNVDELMDRIRDSQYSVKITDVIGMPEQVYEQRFCDLNETQKRLLVELGMKTMSTTLDGKTLDCETILERMCRYQQIVGGHFPYGIVKDDKPGYEIEVIPGKNPKMEALMEILDTIDKDRKVIIWARFYPEQKMIQEALGALWYRGGLTTDERGQINRDFQDPDGPRYLVSGAAGYRGVTWTAATLNIYYSNTFSYDDREQIERRSWRKGQPHPVVYLDLTMNHKIDKQILQALKMKEDLANYVDQQLRNPSSQ